MHDPVDGHPNRSDVVYLYDATDRIWEALQSWVAHPERAPQLEIGSKGLGRATLSVGSPDLGYRITSGGTEVARIKQSDQSQVETWQSVFDKVTGDESIRTAARESGEIRLRRDDRLQEFVRAMKELVARINNGTRLKGSCEGDPGL